MPYKKSLQKHIDWTKVHFCDRDKDTAAELCVGTTLVRTHRVALGIPAKGRRKSFFNWDNVDWSLRDCEIARQLGCLQGSVAYQRRKAGQVKQKG
jgi:hypothetical protein